MRRTAVDEKKRVMTEKEKKEGPTFGADLVPQG
jgi:hypothetical protein